MRLGEKTENSEVASIVWGLKGRSPLLEMTLSESSSHSCTVLRCG